MTVRILLVRAVNVGGTAKLPMADFRTMLEDLGAVRARTYIASGNAILDLPDRAGPSEWAEFDRAAERELESRFGFRREVISRSLPELESALADHPFTVADPKLSYVAFLSAAPDQAGIERANQLAVGGDEWAIRGTDLHLRFAAGMGKATLNVDSLLKRLGVAGTARNLRTVTALIELARG
ncbi:MAG TPA: DUF1697 domain-containing protein [Terrimesophilobacter sp.]|nr:DUF1697 domain-containing protein [Terrimesophilobacter sp.]